VDKVIMNPNDSVMDKGDNCSVISKWTATPPMSSRCSACLAKHRDNFTFNWHSGLIFDQEVGHND
jgi:hypothetical protein